MDVELPKLADTLVEGTVTRWLKHAGDQVRQGEPLVEGETVPVGQVIARIADAGGSGAVPDEQASQHAERGPSRAERRAEHVRRAAATVPQGVCAREVAAVADGRLDAAVAAVAGAGAGWARGAPRPRSRLPPANAP